MYIGNMHKKLVKIARVVPEISCRTHRHRERDTHTQTDRRTHDNTSQPLSRAKAVAKYCHECQNNKSSVV